MKRLIVGVLLLSMVGVASADGYGGTCRGLFENWKVFKSENRQPLWQASQYAGYVAGWLDADTYHNKNGINLPAGFTQMQAYQIVGNWLERHPEKWHLYQSICVYSALKEAYGLK